MTPLREVFTSHTPESLVESLAGESGVVLLRSALFDSARARYSFVAARPFLTLRTFGSRCELECDGRLHVQFGDPWHVLDGLMARYELLDELDLPFPLGGCFGYWGYELKNFVEPRLPRRAVGDLELPDCLVGFYPHLVAFDHLLGKTWVVATGLGLEGSRNESRAERQRAFWQNLLAAPPRDSSAASRGTPRERVPVSSNFTAAEFINRVERAREYIRAGDIYQVNLAQRLVAPCLLSGWEFHQRLAAVSPAPFTAYLDGGDFQLSSSSPELFLRMSGWHVLTRPIKGTRPRSTDPTRDAQLAFELQTSPKETAELVMITDLLRNDLGRICEYGSIQAPELARLERFSQVQHLVSTVEGRLREEITHASAFAACFPGGSITGAPKIRAMEIIDELEPIARGPYTGALGYLGFNRESQLAIAIRTAIIRDATAWFHAGAGIVADSIAEAEYEETVAKAGGFITALETGLPVSPLLATRPNWRPKAGPLEF